MVNQVEAEITALQADLAHTIAWLRGDYLPSPLPEVVEVRLAELAARFDALRDMVEDREAEIAFAGTRDQEAVPDAIAGRLLGGESPVRVWRQYRGISLRALAAQAHVSTSALSDLETGKSEGRPGSLRRIAIALGITLDDLVSAVSRDTEAA
jgi:DNA-binding Xre family transcriptional regulator